MKPKAIPQTARYLSSALDDRCRSLHLYLPCRQETHVERKGSIPTFPVALESVGVLCTVPIIRLFFIPRGSCFVLSHYNFCWDKSQFELTV